MQREKAMDVDGKTYRLVTDTLNPKRIFKLYRGDMQREKAMDVDGKTYRLVTDTLNPN
jgi:hypothetical protein